MSSSSQTPDRPIRRDDLILMLLHGGAASAVIAERVVDMFAAEVRDEIAALRAGLETARSLHRSIDGDLSSDGYCNQCGTEWPCPTVAALDSAIKGGAQ